MNCTCLADLRETLEKDSKINEVDFTQTGMFGDLEKGMKNLVEKLPLRFSFNPTNKNGKISKSRRTSFISPIYCFNCGKKF